MSIHYEASHNDLHSKNIVINNLGILKLIDWTFFKYINCDGYP